LPSSGEDIHEIQVFVIGTRDLVLNIGKLLLHQSEPQYDIAVMVEYFALFEILDLVVDVEFNV